MKQHTHQPGSRLRLTIGESATHIGAGDFLVIAGPCAVESRESILTIASTVAEAGAGMLRGGAFKPRTSPHSFQGMGDAGLQLLAEARAASGLPIVTEVVDVRHVSRVAAIADVLQVGARNMSNGPLLRELGQTGLPVLLKRGFGSTLTELVHAAEYILAEGNDQIMLVERGIRTFEPSTRFTLDISAVPVLRTMTHLPIIVDPSHPAGRADLVPDLARAAAAVGADGVMVEVHDMPHAAQSDGDQALTLDQFAPLVASLDAILQAVGSQRSVGRLTPA